MKRPSLDPSSIKTKELARLLSAMGESEVTEQDIKSHIEAGAPRNADGTMNLVHYAAWLIRELAMK